MPRVRILLPLPYGPVVQLVRTLACHARGRRFEPVPGRQNPTGVHPVGPFGIIVYAQIAQLVEQWTENPRVAGSIPALGTICGHSSSGRAPPCQGGGSEFEPRNPLHFVRCVNRASGARVRRFYFGPAMNRYLRKFSSAGRASALQAEGQRFEPVNFHHVAR